MSESHGVPDLNQLREAGPLLPLTPLLTDHPMASSALPNSPPRPRVTAPHPHGPAGAPH